MIHHSPSAAADGAQMQKIPRSRAVGHVRKDNEMIIIVIIAVFLIGVVIILWLVSRSARPKIGEIAPANVLQKKYGLYAENRPEIKLDYTKVPDDLQHLIPLAEKWGIGDDIIRSDFEDKATYAEKKELYDAIFYIHDRIGEWLDSFGDNIFFEEHSAFMYMLTANEEIMFDIKTEDRKPEDDFEIQLKRLRAEMDKNKKSTDNTD